MPSSDHTTRDVEGQYVTLQVFDRKQPNQMARLYTPMMTSKGGDCVMHFFYNNINLPSQYNKGETPPSLRVYVRYADGGKGTSKTLFSDTTPTYDWIKGGVKFSSSDPFQFVFEGKVSNSAMSMSLDDVSFSQQCMSSNDTYKPKGKKSKFPQSRLQTSIDCLLCSFHNRIDCPDHRTRLARCRHCRCCRILSIPKEARGRTFDVFIPQK